MKVFLCKYRENESNEFTPVYFNSATKTVINSDKYDLYKSFQEMLHRIDNWINEGYGWIIESIEGQYVNSVTTVHYQEVHTFNYLINQKTQ